MEKDDFYNFPPFFTLQPVAKTRAKQLNLWRDLILDYYRKNEIYTLVISDCELFENKAINSKKTYLMF